MFLITRNETREPDRWEQTVQILVPVRDKEGRLIEVGDTAELFTKPRQKQTEDYITGRFG